MRLRHYLAFIPLLIGLGARREAFAAPPPPRSIAISTAASLNFGTVVRGLSPGTVTIAPDGTRTAVGAFPAGADFAAASFTVTVSGSTNPHYTIVLPASATVTSGSGGSMLVDMFRSNPALTGLARPPAWTETMTVGARLNVSGSQQPGAYSGVFQVVVNLSN